MKIGIVLHLIIADFKMLLRSRQAMFWAIAFPLIFVVVFGIFFSDNSTTTTLAVIDHAEDALSKRIVAEIERIDALETVQIADEAEARRQIREGALGFALVLPEGMAEKAVSAPPAQVRMIYDHARPTSGIILGSVESFIGRANAEIQNVPPSLVLAPEGVSGRNLTSFDFILPGLAVWGVMSFSVIVLAVVLTGFREKRIFLRLQATPLRVRTFFLAQILTHLILALAQVAIIIAVGIFVFGAKLNGNLFYLAIILILANLVFLNMGFIVAAYARTAQAASGIGNAVVLPLMFFSGAFFPTDALPYAIRLSVDVLPLAPTLTAMRGVALEAKPLWDFPIELATLACWMAITAIIAIRAFKFR